MNVKSCLMSWFLCMVVAESYSFPPMSRLSRSSRKLHLCYSAANCECHYWWVYMFLFFFLYRSVYSNWVALLARPYHHWLRWTTAGTEAQLVFGPCIWKKRWKGGGSDPSHQKDTVVLWQRVDWAPTCMIHYEVTNISGERVKVHTCTCGFKRTGPLGVRMFLENVHLIRRFLLR